MQPIILALALLFAFAAPANAEVYKCQSQDGKVVYSDVPCKSGTQTVTDIPVTAPDAAIANHSESTALAHQLDNAVKAAIADHDLQRAQALATTREHWDWIAAAKREANQAPVLGRTEADLSAERGDSQACQQAIRSYELEANSSFDEPETLNAKKSIMNAVCGIKEPLEVNNYPAPATALYPPLGLRPHYRRGFPPRSGWGNRAHRNPVQAEPPAVSVIVGPANQ